MGKSNKDKKKEAGPSNKDKDNPTSAPFIEGIDDQDEDVRALLPSQEHCSWLVNIIRIHSKKMAKELLEEHEQRQVNLLTQQISALEKKLIDVEGEVALLRSDNSKKQRRIERLEYANSNRQSEISDLKIKLDDFEQNDYDLSMQIIGLPENKDGNEDIKQFTKVIKDKTGIKIKSTEIVEFKRMGKKNDTKVRNAIVTFKDKQCRQKVYDERKKLIKQGNPAKSIYLN